MYLKSLTLRGFKSFASATTLRLEPGITCVVGPNGSGKSNILDALRWVMGEQGAKGLRGGKMADVIFAGTSGRAPLGRAEVTLTIDNSDGALPIEYSEVSITRRMFRDGGGEYEINGRTCRLMDVQELLSDSGIGREMHVVVGQGQLSAILESRPEERRAYIEEAAGVLKHRRRREKAARKIEAMAANLSRLTDLTAELRRQLKPLGRQAEMARRAQTVQADLRDAKLRLAADDLVTRRAELATQAGSEATLRARQEEVAGRLAEVERLLAAHEAELTRLEPGVTAAQQAWFTLSALAERVGATGRIAAERRRHLSEPVQVGTGRDPEDLDAQAEAAAEDEAELLEAVEEAAMTLEGAREALADCDERAAVAEREHTAAVALVADRREGLARLQGEVATLRAKVESGDGESARLDAAIDAAAGRVAEYEAELAEHAETAAEIEAAEPELNEHYERSAAALDGAEGRVAELVAAERVAERGIASLEARIEALSLGLRRGDGGAWLLANGDGVIGAVAGLVTVEEGWEAAIAAALGPAGDAVAVVDADAAAVAVAALRGADLGRAVVLHPTPVPAPAAVPDGCRAAADVVGGDERVTGALAVLLAGTVVADDAAAARAALATGGVTRVVTRDGDLFGPGWAVGGAGSAPSAIEVQASVDAAAVDLGEVRTRLEEVSAALSGASTELESRRTVAEQALLALHDSDGRLDGAYERLAQLGQQIRDGHAEQRRLRYQRDRAEERRDETLARLADAEARLAALESSGADVPADISSAERDVAMRQLAAARGVETEARLAMRSAEERSNAVRGRAEQLRRAARAEREARARAAEQQRRRAEAAAVADAVARGAQRVADAVARAVTDAAAVREELTRRRDAAVVARNAARTSAGDLGKTLTTLRDEVHRDEVARAQAQLRIEQLEEQILEAWGIAPDDIVAEYGPDVPLPPSALELAEYEQAKERGELVVRPQPMPYDRRTQQRRAKQAEQDLKSLGRINPLALEEFAALEERYTFLSTQLEDVKAARADLLAVIEDVDARIQQVFAEAWVDVEREFVDVFQTLFPGGEGRLVLTDPSNMLTTGIDVEARPPGKKVKRLSLLSGGEKSLTAVAMLVAIFRARPSPFYVMDEVEAALDDTNLRRLLTLFEQLRDRSQLIVITHQKPTMEIADALYGVSMRGDGITQVISQRLRGVDLVGSRPAIDEVDV